MTGMRMIEKCEYEDNCDCPRYEKDDNTGLCKHVRYLRGVPGYETFTVCLYNDAVRTCGNCEHADMSTCDLRCDVSRCIVSCNGGCGQFVPMAGVHVDEYTAPKVDVFEKLVRERCNRIAETVIEKNRKYGDSFRQDRLHYRVTLGMEKLPFDFHIREKLRRYVAPGNDDEDSVLDIAGYAVLEMVCRELDNIGDAE